MNPVSADSEEPVHPDAAGSRTTERPTHIYTIKAVSLLELRAEGEGVLLLSGDSEPLRHVL